MKKSQNQLIQSAPHTHLLLAVTLGVFLVLLSLWMMPWRGTASAAGSQTPPPTASASFMSPRIQPPVLPDDPLLPDHGEQTFYLLCMPCHGDRGQGLTEEFRREAYQEDMNCWQSKCHASNHPEGGFTFPKAVPPLVGIEALARFETGAQLTSFIQENMPFYKPASLPADDALALAAFLLRENGALPREVEYAPGDVLAALVHSQDNIVFGPPEDRSGLLLGLVSAAAALLLAMVVMANASRRWHP